METFLNATECAVHSRHERKIMLNIVKVGEYTYALGKDKQKRQEILVNLFNINVKTTEIQLH